MFKVFSRRTESRILLFLSLFVKYAPLLYSFEEDVLDC